MKKDSFDCRIGSIVTIFTCDGRKHSGRVAQKNEYEVRLFTQSRVESKNHFGKYSSESEAPFLSPEFTVDTNRTVCVDLEAIVAWEYLNLYDLGCFDGTIRDNVVTEDYFVSSFGADGFCLNN